MTLTDEVANLNIESEPPTRAEPTPAPVDICCDALTDEWETTLKSYTGPQLSERALNPAHGFIGAEKLDTILRNTYDPVTNPNGKINLGIAENSLLVDEYLEFFSTVLKDQLTPLDLAYGNQASGSKRLHKAIADMWNENFNPILPVHPDHIVTGPGASGVLDQLVSVLLNPGEAILIAAPHYNGFDVNMVARSYAHVEHVKVPAAQAFDPSSLDYFEKSLEDCKARGVRVGAVMLCHPQNPFGQCYNKETLLAYAIFAEKHNLHLISDELYALSIYDNPDHPDLPGFTSMLSLDVEKETGQPFNKGRLHIVYSFSKDFGINGFRVAAIISQHNKLVLRALYHTAFLMKVSSPADVLVSAVLNNKSKFKELTTLNRKRLGEASAYVAEWFKKRGMTPFPCNTGHFMMVDGTKALGLKTFPDELEFSRHCARHGVYVGIGQTYHAHEPGWLRVTFSVNRKVLETALGRLDAALAAR